MPRNHRRPTADHEPPRTVADLCAVTGLGEQLVKHAITDGSLPGYVIPTPGGGCRYVIPSALFNAFCRGDWRPQPKQVVVIRTEAA